MKRLLFALLLIPFLGMAQPGKYQDALLFGKKENRTINIYSMGIPRTKATLNDTAKLYPHLAYVGDTLRIWNVGLQSWINVIGTKALAKNGLRGSVDTLMLGDSLDRYTYIQINASLGDGTPFNQLRLGNRIKSESLNGNLNSPIYKSVYDPSIFYVERLFDTQHGDTAASQYGGSAVFLTRVLRDSLDAVYGVGKKTETLAGGGVYALNQYFPPRDSTILGIGLDGQSGNGIFSQLDVGNYFGYKLNVVPAAAIPDFPLTNIRSSVDLIRNIDDTRTKKMYGAGITGFNAMYKSYQHTINMSTYQAGNFWERTIDYMAYGDANPLISGATKAYTLGVAEVKQAIGFYAVPHYRYTNTVRDGYGFVARGDSDYNHLPWLNIGPYSTLPTRAGLGNKSWTRRLYVNGDMESTGNSYAFVSNAYGFAADIPIAIGTEAGMNFKQTDTALVGTVGAYLVPSNRNLRGMYFRSEMYNGATMDNTQTGGFVQIETGVNHAFATRWWRNGGMVVNRVSGTTDQYRLYKKFVLNGGALLCASSGDTLTVKNVPSVAWDAANLKPLVMNSNGDVLKTSANVVTSLTATATLNFPNVVAQTSEDLTITVTGAVVGMPVSVGVPVSETPAGTNVTAFVSAADTVTVRFNVYRLTDYDPGSADYTVKVFNN